MPIVDKNGVPIFVSRKWGTERACAECGGAYTVTNITGRQLYCSEQCRERAQWKRESRRPEVVAANRERCRRWATENRSVTRRQPWLLGAPPFGEYLPGGAFSLKLSPPPQWPIELRNTRALHGLVSGLIGEPHDANQPGFVLIPSNLSPSGWGVYVPKPEIALRLAGRCFDGVLFDRDVTVTCGPMHRVKSPRVTVRGRRRLRVDFVTPVCVQASDRLHARSIPTGENLCSTIARWLPRRLGVELDDGNVCLRIIERRTQVQRVPMGGKYGVANGFVGWVVLDVNAVGEWLLRCAETIGLGGRCAFGLGRIRVSRVE